MPNISIGHNYILSKSYTSSNDDNNDTTFEKNDIVEVKEIRQDQCLVSRIKDDYEGWLSIDVLHPIHIDKLQVPTRNHYSLACHLNPRLSESNFSFHDIFWSNYCNSVRKRDVKLSKFIKIISINNHLKEKQKLDYRIQCFLYDCGSKVGRQTVSNVHELIIPSTNNNGNFFFSKFDYPTFLLRSNYNQSEVVLKLNVIKITKNKDDEEIRELVGSVIIDLLNKENNVIISNNTSNYPVVKIPIQQNQNSDTSIRISIFNVPLNQKSDVDMLPDVIICKAEYICLFSIFRNICAYQLFSLRGISDMDYINDDFIKTFLEIVDNDEVVNHLHLLCIKHKVYKSKNRNSSFMEIYKKYIIPLTCIYGIKEKKKPEQDLGSQISLKSLQFPRVDLEANLDTKSDFDEINYLVNYKCKPVNLRNCTFQLCNIHSLD